MTLLAAVLTAATLGADPEMNTPPPGFTALFNGTDLAGWQDDGKGHWTVRDGVLHYDGKGTNLKSAKDYGDFELYVDWKIGPKGDSGIYLRGLPQVQIWDTTEEAGYTKLGADKGSGGLWNNSPGAPGKDPLVKADNPVGKWNTFHITMRGDKVTVELNGKKVVDNARMENYMDRAKGIPATGPIELQHHGNPLEFRNIYIKEL